MIRRHLMALRVGLMLADYVLAVAVFWLVAAVRFSDGGSWRSTGIDQTLSALVFAGLWVAVMWASGMYRLSVRWRVWSEVRDLARVTLIVLAITLSALFILKLTDFSRLFLVMLFIAQPTVTLAGRLLLRAAFEARRRRGVDPRYMVVAGSGQLAQDFADRVEGHAGLGLQIIGHLRAPGETESIVTRPILGTIDQIEDIFHSQVVVEVAVCLPATAS